MRRRDPDHLLIALAYDGRPFHGVWPQPDVPTVADALYERLEAALGRRPQALAVVARTDTGVHARINLATVRLWDGADTREVDRACAPRGDGILAMRIARVSSRVHARGLARRKRYIYHWNEPLDREAMARAAAHLVGTLDVSSLRGRRVDPARCVDLTLDRVELRPTAGGTELVVEGARFVRHQVRIMASLLASVGRGARDPDSMPELLARRDTRHGAAPAPGDGLTLAGLQLVGDPRWLTAVHEVNLGGVRTIYDRDSDRW